jgi:hypothetical protein
MLAHPLLLSHTVATGQLYPLLLCDHNSDDIVVVDRLTIATVGYGSNSSSLS